MIFKYVFRLYYFKYPNEYQIIKQLTFQQKYSCSFHLTTCLRKQDRTLTFTIQPQIDYPSNTTPYQQFFYNNIQTTLSMYPLFQILPNNPFSSCTIDLLPNMQYMTPFTPQFNNQPLNTYPQILLFNYHPELTYIHPLAILTDEKSTDTPFQKTGTLRHNLKTKPNFNKNQEDTKPKQNIHENQSDFMEKRKKTQPKNRIIKYSQNKNRNVIPSVVQQIFSYLSKPNKSRPIVQKVLGLFETSSPGVSIQRYFYFIKRIKDILNHYLNINSLSVLFKVQETCLELIPREEQILYLSVARKVAKHFIDNQLPLLIIHSKRMFSDKRIEHLRVRRLLLQVLDRREC